jgi:hypothetical protein
VVFERKVIFGAKPATGLALKVATSLIAAEL